jgi:hypothetical protein
VLGILGDEYSYLEVSTIMPIAQSEPVLVVVLIIVLAVLLILLKIIGGLPGDIAERRGHKDASAIRLCGYLGLLFGGIFWLVALIWAHTGPDIRQAHAVARPDLTPRAHAVCQLCGRRFLPSELPYGGGRVHCTQCGALNVVS